jgi:hypothetical protein
MAIQSARASSTGVRSAVIVKRLLAAVAIQNKIKALPLACFAALAMTATPLSLKML